MEACKTCFSICPSPASERNSLKGSWVSVRAESVISWEGASDNRSSDAQLIIYRHLLLKMERGEHGDEVRMGARVWRISSYSEVIRSFLGAFTGDRTETPFQAQIPIPPHIGHRGVQEAKWGALLGDNGGSGVVSREMERDSREAEWRVWDGRMDRETTV